MAPVASYVWPAESPEEAQKRKEAEAEFQRKWKIADFWEAAKNLKEDIGIGNNDPEDIAPTVEEARAQEKKESGESGSLEDDLEVQLASIDPQEFWGNSQEHSKERPEQISENKLDEQVYAPLINRVLKAKILNAQQAQEIKEKLVDGGDFEEVIRWMESIDRKVQQSIIDRWGELNSEEGAEKFTEQFKKDFWPELTNSLDDKKEFILDSLNYIAPSYLSAWDSASPEEKKDALNMAVEMWINNFLDGKQFERTEAFEIDLQNVKNPDLTFQERIQAFENIMKQVGTDQWAKSLKAKESYQKSHAGEAKKMKGKIELAQDALIQAQKDWNKEKIQDAEIALKDAQENKDTIETWDAKVLGGGKLDVVAGKQETWKKEA